MPAAALPTAGFAPDARPEAIALVGPTACGKSALALELAERLAGRAGFEIVSVDSAQVFIGMDIGTAKPDAATRAALPHHLIDLIDPEAAYSAGRFVTDATAAIAAIRARGAMPLLVGGTMLYVKALIDGIAPLPAADAAMRAAIDAEAAQRGWPALHAELARLDPAAAARIDPNHSQRIQRALELVRVSGRTLDALYAAAPATAAPRLLPIALVPGDRAKLHQEIARRFLAMLAAGLVDEVIDLRRRHVLDAGMPSMRCVGYRQVWEMLEGHTDRATMQDKGIAATRQLAKRQLTWLRGLSGFLPLDPFAAGCGERLAALVEPALVD